MSRNRLAYGQQVVHDHTEAHHPHAAPAAVVNRDSEPQSTDEMRGEALQKATLTQRLEDQREFAVLEVTEPAVYQAAGPARGSTAEVASLQQQNA